MTIGRRRPAWIHYPRAVALVWFPDSSRRPDAGYKGLSLAGGNCGAVRGCAQSAPKGSFALEKPRRIDRFYFMIFVGLPAPA